MLLDIAIPGMDGIDVARALSDSPVDPAVVFVTAFDNFAVAAFDVAAIDYLMKPVQVDRLERALVRVREHLAGGRRAGRREAPAYVEEFWVPDLTGLVRIAASDIARITAERDYMRLHVGTPAGSSTAPLPSSRRISTPRVPARPPLGDPAQGHDPGLYPRRVRPWTARLSDGGEQRIGAVLCRPGEKAGGALILPELAREGDHAQHGEG